VQLDWRLSNGVHAKAYMPTVTPIEESAEMEQGEANVVAQTNEASPTRQYVSHARFEVADATWMSEGYIVFQIRVVTGLGTPYGLREWTLDKR
jgi:hypothetical protein